MNRAGVTVIFPASYWLVADAWLVARGVNSEACWLAPTSAASGEPILKWTGGAR